MPRPLNKSAESKFQIVMSVLRGELSAPEAGRKAGVSEQSVHKLKRRFLEAGKAGLAQGAQRSNTRELRLAAENEEVKTALGEAHVELRVWKKGAEYLPGSRTLR